MAKCCGKWKKKGKYCSHCPLLETKDLDKPSKKKKAKKKKDKKDKKNKKKNKKK
ncbi:hypothetical protein QBE53_08890 [Vallitaleaceae bacterium 9-2]